MKKDKKKESDDGGLGQANSPQPSSCKDLLLTRLIV